MKNIKKLCLFAILLVNILLISNVKAEVTTQVFNIDYNTNDYETLLPIYEEIKTWIDTNNINNAEYMIGFNGRYNSQSGSRYIWVLLHRPRNNDTKINNIYMRFYRNNGTGSSDTIAYYPVFQTNNGTSFDYVYFSRINISSYNNTTTKQGFYNLMNNFLNHSTGYNGTSNNGTQNSPNSSNPAGLSTTSDYIAKTYTSAINMYDLLNGRGFDIYYSSLPIFYTDSKAVCQPNQATYCYNNVYTNSNITTICNTPMTTSMISNTSSLANVQTYYNNSLLSCGDTYPTYIDYEEENSIYEIQEPFYNIDRQTESIDMYINIGLPQSSLTDERNIILEYTFNENALDNYYVNGYYMFGKVCNYTTQYLYGTCWWEEVPHTYWSISDDTYTEEENNYKVTFKLTYDFTNSTTRYETIKLAIKQIANDFTLHIKSKEEKYNITTDINVIGYNYGFQTVGTTNNIVQILVDKKPINNNDINYTFYRIGEEEYGALNFFEYDKLTNTTTRNYIDSSIIEAYRKYIPNHNNYIQYWKELGQIILGPNSNKKLLIFIYAMDYDDEYGEVYKFYFSNEVYYTITNNNTFNIDYTENGTTINQDLTPRLDNDFIQQEYNNSLSVNISGLEELIMSYKEYKNEWIQLFNSIWIPMPDILKNILIIMYALAHCYGVYLIFKD